MKQSLIKITSGEPILTQPHLKTKFHKNFTHSFQKITKTNVYFGIEENVSNQIWFYGFFTVSISLLLFTYLISGILYGF